MSFDNFFEEWKDGKKVVLVSGFMTMFMLLSLFWIIANVEEQARIATIYVFLLIGAIIAAVTDVFNEKNWLFSYVDYGKDFKVLGTGLILGGILAFVLSGSDFSIAPQAVAINSGLFGFIYVVIVASYVEEKFFRGVINPTAGRILKGLKITPFPMTMGVIFGSIFFALFHWFAYGGLIESMFGAFVFAIIVTIGNHVLKTRGFGIGAHIVNNFIAIGGVAALVALI